MNLRAQTFRKSRALRILQKKFQHADQIDRTIFYTNNAKRRKSAQQPYC